MKFDVDKIYFGVGVELLDRKTYTYVKSSDTRKVWFEDGFFYIDDGKNEVICIVAPNVKQFTKKITNEQRSTSPTRVSKTKLEQ
jgi:hypothetical protein